MDNQPSHSISTALCCRLFCVCFAFQIFCPSANQQLQAVVKVSILRRAGGQKGRGHGSPRRRGDVEEGVGADAGGRRVAESRGRRDAGQVDAEGEPRLLQGLLGHGEGLQFLLAVGHIGVLAAPADTVQARLGKTREMTQLGQYARALHRNYVTSYVD